MTTRAVPPRGFEQRWHRSSTRDHPVEFEDLAVLSKADHFEATKDVFRVLTPTAETGVRRF